MSAPAAPEFGDGLYSKLIDEDGPYENFTDDPRRAAAPPSARLSPGQRGPALRPGPGLSLGLSPGLYRASTVALAALCVILLICVIAVSTHKQKSATEGEETPQTQKQKQDLNGTELQSIIGRLQEENRKLWERINATKVNQPTVPPARCPTDWLPFNGSCYFVSRRTRSWTDSQEYCVQQGGHLAIILTPEEQTFVWDQLPRGHWNAYWIGITDSHTEDQWKWVDGTPLVGGFWEEGEPNNHIDEDCGYIVKTRVLERVAIRSWYDAPCSMFWPFVCESDGSKAVAPTARKD